MAHELQAHQPADRRAALRRGRPVRPQRREQRRHLARRARVGPRGIADAQPRQPPRVGLEPALHVLDAGVGDERVDHVAAAVRDPRVRQPELAQQLGHRRVADGVEEHVGGRVVADRERLVGEVAQRQRDRVQHRRDAGRRRRCARRSRRARVRSSPVRCSAVTSATLNTEASTTGSSARSAELAPGVEVDGVQPAIQPDRAERRLDRAPSCQQRVRGTGTGDTRRARPPSPPTRRARPAAAPRPRGRSRGRRRAAARRSRRPRAGRPPAGASRALGCGRRLLDQRDGVRGQHEAGGEVVAGGGQHLARDEAERVTGGQDRVVGRRRGIAREQDDREVRRQRGQLQLARSRRRPRAPRAAGSGAGRCAAARCRAARG